MGTQKIGEKEKRSVNCEVNLLTCEKEFQSFGVHHGKAESGGDLLKQHEPIHGSPFSICQTRLSSIFLLTGDKVKIPGKNPREPNIYPFGTSYEEIYKDLVKKDRQLYTENGMLHILDRHMRIKHKPEKFQESDKLYYVILTCEERVYDLVIEKFEDSGSVHSRLAHVVNIDVIDN